jgi:DNA invertase Pin-like site-specific DNA recombinase
MRKEVLITRQCNAD